jgi:hypothetical protein
MTNIPLVKLENLGGLQIQSYGRDMLYAVNYWADSHDGQCQGQVCVVGSPVVSATHQNGRLFRSKSRLCQLGGGADCSGRLLLNASCSIR